VRTRAALLLLLLLLLLVLACSTKDKKAGVDAAPSSTSATGASAASVGSKSVDTVTNASQMMGDGGLVMTAGEVDGNVLRIRQRARLKADVSSPVTILKNGSARELGTRICEKSVPSRPKHMPILIKPNIGGFEWFKDPATHNGDDGVHGRTTDSEFVRGIVQCLKKRGTHRDHDRGGICGDARALAEAHEGERLRQSGG
jgi:hypothetical protein